MVDMWFLKDDPWIYLKEKNTNLVSCGEMRSGVVHCYRGTCLYLEMVGWRFGQGCNKGKMFL